MEVGRSKSPQPRKQKSAGVLGPEQRAASSTDLFLLNASRLYQQVIGLVKRHPLLGQEQRGMQVSHRWELPPPHPALTMSRQNRRKIPSSFCELSQPLPTWISPVSKIMTNSADHLHGMAWLPRMKVPEGQVYSWLSLTGPQTAPDIIYHQPLRVGSL